MIPTAKVKNFISSGGHLGPAPQNIREGFLYIFSGPRGPERSINVYASISFSG